MVKFNVTQAKTVPGRDKAVWIRHGVAFQNDQGKIRVKLESIPIPDEKGEIWLILVAIYHSNESARCQR